MSGALDGAGGGGCIAGPEYGKKRVVVVNTVEVEESDGDGDDTPLSALIVLLHLYLPCSSFALPLQISIFHLVVGSRLCGVGDFGAC